jgi:hypothetical protein
MRFKSLSVLTIASLYFGLMAMVPAPALAKESDGKDR